MRYKAVVFDMFGTLADEPSHAFGGMLERMAEAAGVSKEAFERVWEPTTIGRQVGAFPSIEAYVRHVFGLLGLEEDAERVERFVALRRVATRKALTPRADAAHVIDALQRAGVKVAMVSNCSIDVAEVWEEGAIAPLVEHAVLSAAVGLVKPDARIYRMAARMLGVAPADCLYVGDGGDYELAGARNVGMEPLLICVPYEDPAKVWYKQEAVSWTGPRVASLTEVLAYARGSVEGGGRLLRT